MSITLASLVITVVGGYDSGTATGGTTTSLINTGKSLTTNAHAGRAIWIYEGTGVGQRRRIVSNTATTYVPNYAFTTAPDATRMKWRSSSARTTPRPARSWLRWTTSWAR